MNDEQMQPLLDSWFRDREVAPSDVRAAVAGVMAEVPQTRQQRRWWLFPLLGRESHDVTAADTTDYRPSPVPATNGHAPTIMGRTQTMFSPVKAITAGALIFALGGLFLVSLPFGQQGSIPGAEQGAELAPPVVVTISESEATEDVPEVCAGTAPAVCTRGGSLQWSASDPRLSGTVTQRTTEYYWPVGGYAETTAFEVVNDDGAWVGTGSIVQADALGVMGTVMLTGEGAYEGLTAVYSPELEGIIIIDGGLPPVPELAE